MSDLTVCLSHSPCEQLTGFAAHVSLYPPTPSSPRFSAAWLSALSQKVVLQCGLKVHLNSNEPLPTRSEPRGDTEAEQRQ